MKTQIHYNENGNLIYLKNFSGDEEWFEYDENCNITHYENSFGDEEW